MKCSIEVQSQLIEAAKIEFRRLQELQKQGYTADETAGVVDIAESMDNLLKVIRKQPEKIKVTKATEKPELLQQLIKANGSDGTIAIAYNGSNKYTGVKPIKLTELNGAYTLTTDKGTYTFKEGEINSIAKDGKYVTVPIMVLTKKDQMDLLNTYFSGAPMKVEVTGSPVQTGAKKVTIEESVKNYQNKITNWIKSATGVKLVNNDDVLKISNSVLNGIAVEVAKYTPATNTIEQVANLTRAVENQLRAQVYDNYMQKNGLEPEQFSAEIEKAAMKELKDAGQDIDKAVKELVKVIGANDKTQELTHEMVHAGALGFMIDPKNADSRQMKRMEELYQLALDNKEAIDAGMVKDGKVNQYWSTNIHEFVAEGLSNPQLINVLSQIPVKGKDKLSSVLKEFVQTLIDMLGLDKAVKDNIHEYLLDGFASIVEQSNAAENNSQIRQKLMNKQKPIHKTYEFGETYHNANKAANKYVADMAGLMYANSEKWLTPKIQDFHDKQMRTNKVYSKMYNTIKDGTNNIELLNKIVHSLFLTGDVSRTKIAKLTKMVEDSNRPAMEILTTEMPEWDKKVSAAIKGDKEQQLLTEIYGLSGYGALSDYYIDGKSVLKLLDEGAKPSELMDQLGLNKGEEGIVVQLHDRLVNHQVQASGIVNAGHNNKIAAAVVLYAMTVNNGVGYKLHQKVKTKHKEIHDKLVEMAVNAYTINNMVNKGLGSMDIGDRSEFMYTDYEGHGLLDIYSNSHEFKVITEAEYNSKDYQGKYNPWERMETDNKNPGFVIVFRKSQEVYEQGLGVNMDRIQNGLYIDSSIVNEGLKKDKDWLVKNNVQKYTTVDGTSKYRVVLSKKQAIQAEGMNNVIQSLYRSVVHNTQLIEQQTMRKMIKAELTEDGSTHQKLRLLERRIQYNKRTARKDRKELKPYLRTDVRNEELVKKYPLIAAEYQIATNISQYEGLNRELRYVRKGMVDIMVGFRSGTIVHDSMPWLQDIERRYKQLVALKKLKMVVASPTKLMSDIMSNAAILMALDVDPQEGGKDMKEAFDYWNTTSDMEAEIVRLKMQLISAEASGDKQKIAKVKAQKDAMDKKMQNHPFYDAYRYGFVQSMATSMMIKEFDTVSGLQHTIDEVVKKVTTDEKHNPNAVHKAIVKFMHWGYSIEDIAKYAGNASKLKGTMFGDELIEMGNRLADHKKVGEENVAGYITEIIAGPQSELVRQGSRVMQMGDLASRWALYKHTVGENLEKELGRTVSKNEINDVIRGNRLGLSHAAITDIKEKAAMRALDTFVDYRLNLPSSLKKASDLGILWFPSYWLRNTVVIPQMIAAKPLNSMVAIALSGVTGMSTVYESHPLWKILSDKKSLVHPGMDVTTLDTFIPFVP